MFLLVGWLCVGFFWFILIFCLSTCCVHHLMETAEDCVFLGGAGQVSLGICQANTDKK